MDFKSLKKILSEPKSFSVFGHINPDGDSIGALLSTRIIALSLGAKDIKLYSRGGVPDDFMFLPGAGLIEKKAADGAPPADVAILVDCGGPKRIGDELLPLLKSSPFVVVIDHHVTNGGFGNLNIIDSNAASTCEILAKFIEAENIGMPLELAQCLYTGIMYDTGRFLHSNTTPEVFRICADLVARGANPHEIAVNVFNRRRFERLKLLGYSLVNMKTAEDNAVSWSVADRKTYEELGAEDEDSDGIVETLGAYKGCEAHISFSESKDGRARVSMRSSGRIDVGAICAKFGGGGHKFAAGIRMDGPLSLVEQKVVAEVCAAARALKNTEGRDD